MAIKRAAQSTPKPEVVDAGNVTIQFVEEVPSAIRLGAVGRRPNDETLAIIEALQARPNEPAYLGVTERSQPNRTLRNNGIIQRFRRRNDGEGFDHYAEFVGVENIPPTVPRGPRAARREAEAS